MNMIYGIYGLEGLLLFGASIEDVRKREVRIISILAMGAVALCGCLTRINQNWYGTLGGLFIGICMIGISLISQEQIGKGDGMVIAALGMLCGVRNTLGMVCFASLFMLLPAFVVMVKKKGSKKTRLPFLPALFLGYILVCLLGGVA